MPKSRKIIVRIAASADGSIASPDGTKVSLALRTFEAKAEAVERFR
jgi:hypothetical protein